uniref:Uncharacterized protein n=1 Tax=Leptospirillum sp. Group II '5-way CG' TaxID=419541 RepID=B6AP64_9BACT|nr:MAG: Hypothetical protein CGL2_10284004 [Leptospirillum sp. Group II '5-way CG']
MRVVMHLVSALAWVSGLITDAKEHKTKLVMAGIAGHFITEFVINPPSNQRFV